MSTLRLTSPGDLLAALPRLMGIVPQNSVLVLGMSSASQMVGISRIDHRDCTATVAPQMAARIASRLRREGAVAVLVVLFAASDDIQARTSLPGLMRWLEGDIQVLDVLVVSDGRYWSVLCEGQSCCPAEGTELPPVPAHVSEFLGEPLFTLQDAPRCDGQWDELTEAELTTIPTDQKRARRVVQAHQEALQHRHRDLQAWRSHGWETWKEAIILATEGITPDEIEAGQLLAALVDVRVRDALLLDLYGGSAGACRSLLRGGDPEEVGAMVQSIFRGNPHSEQALRLEATLRVAARIIETVSTAETCDDVAAALTLAGLCHRWLGRHASAMAAIVAALERDPHYSLAGLVYSAWSADI